MTANTFTARPGFPTLVAVVMVILAVLLGAMTGLAAGNGTPASATTVQADPMTLVGSGSVGITR